MSAAAEPLQSVHTSTLPALLAQIGSSVAVSTYQAGKLIVVRADGELANTHFRSFDTPMGLALDGGRLIVGTRTQIQEFRDQPAVAAKLPPAGRHDACYLPKTSHTTGQIAGHEISFGANGEVWVVNTRFSCLCTLDATHSFVPRWRPPFVTALAPEDRCHLNGMCVVGGAPKYVTALGATDSNAAWRANKAAGGVLMEVPSGRIIASGLSMPHSPRWHDGRLWFLNSGAGGLCVADPVTGAFETVATLPGFTRGLDFFGPLAFVGLSQVRESALFAGLQITERPVEERACGMWVVDTRTGETVAFLRFQSGVQEVFAVQVMPGARFPDIRNEPDDDIIANAFVLPDDALADVPDAAT
jgi:uncharacterized protein (TIGR03032 family)